MADPVDKFRSPLNHPAVERLVESLYAVQDACLALFEAHGEACECDYCEDAEWIASTMKVALPLYESNLLPFPAMNDRWQKRCRDLDAQQAATVVKPAASVKPAPKPPAVRETSDNPFYAGKGARPWQE